MIFNRAFAFLPYLPPVKNSAALRGRQLKNFAVEKFQTTVIKTQEDLLFPFPSNGDHKIARLLKEILCGFELFTRVLFSNYNYYIFSSPPFFIALFGASAAAVKNKPYLFDVRDLYPQVFTAFGLTHEKSYLYKALLSWTNWIYRKSHQITTVTEALCKRIHQQSEKQPILARNGHDDDIKPSEVKKKNFSCIYHGNLGQFQRIDLIISLASKLPEIDFYIAGDGPKKSLLSNAPSNLIYLGNLKREDIVKELGQCHLGLSFLEDSQVGRDSFPVKVYEFFGAGLPCATTPKNSEVSSTLELLKTGESFSPDDIESVASFINELYNNPVKYKNYLNQLNKVQGHFSRQSSSQTLADQVF